MLSPAKIWCFFWKFGEWLLSLWFFFIQRNKILIYFQQNSMEGDDDDFADTYDQVAESWEYNLRIYIKTRF